MPDVFDIISRQEWGARPPNGSLPDLLLPVRDVFLHHEGGGQRLASMTPAQEMEAMRSIQTAEMSEGYTDFPYGCAVFPSGRCYEGRDLGFVWGGVTEAQAATSGQNSTSISIVWPGNYQNQSPTAIQIKNTGKVVQVAQLAGNIAPNPVNLRGHRDVYATACPGLNAYLALDAVRAAIRASVTFDPAVITAWLRSFDTVGPLRRGMRGPRVKTLNDILLSKGLVPGTGVVYGRDTSLGVQVFKASVHWDNTNGEAVGKPIATRMTQ